MKRSITSQNIKKQGGWLSIQMIGVLIITAMAGASFSKYYVAYQSNATASVLSHQLTRITKATESYVKTNWQSLLADAEGGAATIEFAQLMDGGYLQANTSNTNIYGQEYIIRAIASANDSLTVLIIGEGGQISSNGSLTGSDLTVVSKIIPTAARTSGINAGFIPYQVLPDASPMTLEGPDGTWIFDLSTVPSLSSLNIYQGALASVIHLESGSLNNDYLYRSNVGIPELNRMETTLDMHGNDVLDAGTILARDVVLDDVRVDGTLPASVSRGVYTMTRMFPGDTIAKPDCRAPGSSESVFVSVDSSPVGGSPGQGINVKTTSGTVTGQVMSVRTRAVSAGSSWRLLMDVYMVGGTAGTRGDWYTLLPAEMDGQYEASMIVSTKCS